MPMKQPENETLRPGNAARIKSALARTTTFITVAAASGMVPALAAEPVMEEVEVIASTPTGSGNLQRYQVAANVQTATADDLEQMQSVDITDYLNRTFASVNLNSAQGNPLQPDLQYRGFTASPLLGLAQGISIYQNGFRINDPIGDSVSWDLLPESAIERMDLVSGANPLYGLNSLGGALSIRMKDGFSYEGHSAEASGGSFGRYQVTAETGGNNGEFGYYLNYSRFDEKGWRDLSQSDSDNIYSALSYRSYNTSANLNFQYGDSNLTGNGASPVGLLEIDRAAVFTAPDITENRLYQFGTDFEHVFSDTFTANAVGFYRNLKTSSFNGDGSDFIECSVGAAGVVEAEGDFEEQVEDACENGPFADAAAFIAAVQAEPGGGAFGASDFEALEVSGTGVAADGAINNRSNRKQETYGFDLTGTLTEDLFDLPNQAIFGVGFFNGSAEFASTLELSEINPVTRSTAGLGTGGFIEDEEVSVSTRTRTYSVYFTDTLSLTSQLDLSIGLRYNNTSVDVRDMTGEAPELNGSHTFQRANPSVGMTFMASEAANLYASYSESSRAPTPIELSCNEATFELKRQLEGLPADAPLDVCRLPNAFVADPPLEQVVAKGIELGTRGEILAGVNYHAGVYRITNHDDIIWQTADVGGQGLFAQVDKTRRQGFEGSLFGTTGPLNWFMNYGYLDATYQSSFSAISPEHDFANADGEIQVRKGDRIPGIPAHQLKLGADYLFPFGLTVGADMAYFSDQYLRGDESNQLATVDGYTVFNLRASYDVTNSVQLFANVQNLFNKDYENFGLLGEDPNELEEAGVLAPFPLANDSARFLGAGAPRAGFVGLRIRL